MTDEEYQRWYGTPDPGVLSAGISEDGRDIILQATGTDTQLKETADTLRHLTVLPRHYKNKHHGLVHVPLTWAVVTQCAKLAGQKGFKWKPAEDLNAWIYEEFLRRFAEYKDTSDLKFDVSSLDWEPMPHQLAGAYLGAVNRRILYADAAGTGKTRTVLLTLAELDARGLDPWPVFVVTPASVVDPWLEELEECFPDWTFTAYRGAKRFKLSTRYQVYVMSWDVFRRDMYPEDKAACPNGHGSILWKSRDQKELDKHLLGQISTPAVCVVCHDVMLPADTGKHELPPLLDFAVPRTVVMDESHALVNVKTKQSIAANKIARVVPGVLLASGTPITRDIGGFWRAHSVLDTRSFPDIDRYKERYTDRYKRDYGQPEVEGLTTVNREEFFTVIQGSMRRVSKQDVLKDLPDKTYQTRVVTLPPAYRRSYNEMEEDMLAHLPDSDEPLPVMSTLAQLTRLTQLASSACDVEVTYVLDEKEDSLTFGEEIPHYTVTMRDPSWKVDELMAVIEESDGEPIITTSPHAQLVKLAGARAEKAGYRTGYIVGGQSAKARTAVRHAFQNGELDLLCVTTSAGGVGLTLTRAHTMVVLERPFAFWQADQMEDRIHRRGQEGQVTIIDIVASDTVESRVRETLKDKAGQLSELVRDKRIVESFLKGQKVKI